MYFTQYKYIPFPKPNLHTHTKKKTFTLLVSFISCFPVFIYKNVPMQGKMTNIFVGTLGPGPHAHTHLCINKTQETSNCINRWTESIKYTQIVSPTHLFPSIRVNVGTAETRAWDSSEGMGVLRPLVFHWE